MKWIEINKELDDLELSLDMIVDGYYYRNVDEIMTIVKDIIKRIIEEGDK